jgi:hypothetical protein
MAEQKGKIRRLFVVDVGDESFAFLLKECYKLTVEMLRRILNSTASRVRSQSKYCNEVKRSKQQIQSLSTTGFF